MYEIAIMNPRRKKSRAKRRRKNVRAKSVAKRNSKGRFVKRSNPRKRRRSRAHNPRKYYKVRRRRARAVAANPRRKRRRSNPRHHYKVRRRHRNPRFNVGALTGGLMPAAIGGAGALANSVLLGYLTPMVAGFAPFLSTGYGLHALRIGSAIGLDFVGKKFGGRHGGAFGSGALTVAMYLLFRDVAVAFAPTLPLGDYEEISIDSTSDQIGAYMDPAARLGAYMSGGRLPDGSRGVGAYMSGAYNADENYSEPSDGFTLNGIDY